MDNSSRSAECTDLHEAERPSSGSRSRGASDALSLFEVIGLDGTVSPMAVHEVLVPIDQARRFVVDSCQILGPRTSRLENAVGSVMAEDVRALEDVPPFANSAVDGYAVLASDTSGASAESPVVFDVLGEVAAGAHCDLVVERGRAVRIMTGAPIPEGADSVVMVEDTSVVGEERLGKVEVRARVSPGSAIRSAGDDVQRGDLVFRSGTLITPLVAGVLASVNCRNPLVRPRPRVGVLSTGDELVDDGSPLERGQIRESNRTMLLALVDQSGAIGVDYGIVRDDENSLVDVLRTAAMECDAIVTSGGVSMGDYDVVKAVLGRIADMSWMQIAIKPAKPFAFGMLNAGERAVPVFGLPGNPVSSMVSFELLARPALRKMAGIPSDQWDRPIVRSIADEPLRRSRDGKIHYQRVRAHFAGDGRVHVVPVRAQGSHQLAASAMANALAILPDGDGIDSGRDVDVVLLLS
ncbi:MAG: molybdopterin biosynthesis protein MoeA [Actinomycetota bacterium]